MKRSFGKVVREVIHKSDVVVEVLDARLIDMSRSQELEDYVAGAEKRLVIAINKADLVPTEYLERKKKYLPNCVFVSSVKRYGFSNLREMIYKVAAKNKSEKIMVGVIGYPNVGKSSIINGLKGKASAGVSSRSGFTRGQQLVRATRRITLIDTPGVIPLDERDPAQLALLGSKNPDQIKEPDIPAMSILELLDPELIQKHYAVDPREFKGDVYDLLEQIAIAKKRLEKGGEPDIKTMSKIIIQDWQRGKLI